LLYFVLTTGECNLQCRYCGGSFPENEVPHTIKYDLTFLKRLIESDHEATVAFYGGEPLLNCSFIETVMDRIKAKRFVIQTNGILTEKLDKKYWNRMNAVLLSIDGAKKITDYNRGKGTYDAVIHAAALLKENGFSGDLIARMAVSEQGDILRDVSHLIDINLFDHIHWQLDVGWSDRWNDFDGWCEKNYMPGLLGLLERWSVGLEAGKVLGIVPFLGILKRLREGGPTPPCGSGSESLSIMPDGTIRACPISFDASWASLGSLEELGRAQLRKVGIFGECIGCSYFLWGLTGFKKVCDITKFTIGAVSSKISKVNQSVSKGTIRWEDIDYPKYNNSTEIIP